jgi:hypothetical protein
MLDLVRRFLVVKGEVDEPGLEMFKRDFRAAIQNAANYWRPPVIRVGSEAEVEWIAIDRSNKDMEYSQLFDFIVKLATGVYQISPEEVNWQIGQSGAAVTYNSGAKDRLAYSQDKGLRPLLNFMASHLNSCVIHPINENLSLEFTGLGSSKQEEAEIRVKEVESYKTLNEVRAEAGLKPVDGGDIVLNPIYAQSIKLAAPETTPGSPVGTDSPKEDDSDYGAFLGKRVVGIDWSHSGG